MALDESSELLDTDAVADILGVHPGTIRNWRHLGGNGPPAIRVGGRKIRYRRSDVEAWLNANKVEGE